MHVLPHGPPVLAHSPPLHSCIQQQLLLLRMKPVVVVVVSAQRLDCSAWQPIPFPQCRHRAPVSGASPPSPFPRSFAPSFLILFFSFLLLMVFGIVLGRLPLGLFPLPLKYRAPWLPPLPGTTPSVLCHPVLTLNQLVPFIRIFGTCYPFPRNRNRRPCSPP